jgi:hypothetical protein
VHVESHVHVLSGECARDDRRAQAPAGDVERATRRGLHGEPLLGQRRRHGIPRLIERKK